MSSCLNIFAAVESLKTEQDFTFDNLKLRDIQTFLQTIKNDLWLFYEYNCTCHHIPLVRPYVIGTLFHIFLTDLVRKCLEFCLIDMIKFIISNC